MECEVWSVESEECSVRNCITCISIECGVSVSTSCI